MRLPISVMALTRFSYRRAASPASFKGRPGFRRPLDGVQIVRRTRDAALERTAVGICLVLALASGSFATYTLTGPSRDYAVQGFLPAAFGSFAWKREAMPVRSAGIDLDPLTTGSLPDGPANVEAASVDRVEGGAPARGYVLRRVENGLALVEGPRGLRQVSPGTVLPGAGRVISIRSTGAGWVVVTSETIIGPSPL